VEIHQLIEDLARLRANMLELEETCVDLMQEISEPFTDSARNLLHYVALRRSDLRHVQERLVILSLSSLGRAEGCVLKSLDAVLRILCHLGQLPAHDPELLHPVPTFAEREDLYLHLDTCIHNATPLSRWQGDDRIKINLANLGHLFHQA